MPRRSLESQHFQVVVIGGGLSGVAIARECARAGRRTLLLEQNDFGSAASSHCSRTIHGGWRFLEGGEIGLVRDCLRERQKLLRERPHLVRPQQFLFALPEGGRRSAMSARTSLWLYRRMPGATLQVHSDRSDYNKLERLLDPARRWSILDYEDAQCEFPERLLAEWLREAVAAGAEVRNHTQVLAVDVRQGRARGILLRDQFSGKEERVEALWTINATGAWAERLCQRSGINRKTPLLHGVREAHIVLPKFSGAPNSAVVAETSEGRAFSVVPWNEQLLVGTTAVSDRGDPARAAASPEEIESLLGGLRRLFPHTRLSRRDVRYAYAAIRALPPGSAKDDEAHSYRLQDHEEDGAANLLSVVGGDLVLAMQLGREVATHIGVPGRRGSAGPAESGVAPQLDRWTVEVAEALGLSESAAQSLVEWHGGRSGEIARLALSSPALRAPLCQHTRHMVAEAVEALQHECALTLADALLRRVPVTLASCWSAECSRQASARVATVMGWNSEQAAQELETLETERAALLVKPSQFSALEAAAD
jgi:glycerol-3-phosphate dehydrogenase